MTDDVSPEPRLYRPDQVASLLALSRSQVYKLISRGVLPSILIGTSRRIPADALRHWVAARTTPTPEES